MDVVKYFKEQIADELEGALEYAKNAFTMKAMDPSWAKQFIDMASMELNHATRLYSMFEQFYQITSKGFNELPEYIEETRDCIIDCYTTKQVMIKGLIDLYNKG